VFLCFVKNYIINSILWRFFISGTTIASMVAKADEPKDAHISIDFSDYREIDYNHKGEQT
jgi:hypothetical protein